MFCHSGCLPYDYDWILSCSLTVSIYLYKAHWFVSSFFTNVFDNDSNNNNDDNYTDNKSNRIQTCKLRFFKSPHCTAIHLQHIDSSGRGTIVCKSHATHWALTTYNMLCYVPHGTKGHLNYQVWQTLNHIHLSFILLAEPLADEGGEETRVPGENHWYELQNMPHTRSWRFKPQARFEHAW